MPNDKLWAAALSQLLILQESGCPHSARHAIRLLDRLCECDELDTDLRALCERASQRLGQQLPQRGALFRGHGHARAA